MIKVTFAVAYEKPFVRINFAHIFFFYLNTIEICS